MTDDYSKLPHLTPVALLTEEPWLRLPSWRFPRRVWWAKLPALLAIAVWCGIVAGIQVGSALPDRSIEQVPQGITS